MGNSVMCGVGKGVGFLVGLVLATLAEAETPWPQRVQLASTDWCPYTCEHDTAQPGVVYEYLEQLFAELDIALDIGFYPWSRAIQLVREGRVHGLLTATHEEAPGLAFTRAPTLQFQSCFFAAKDNSWRYDGLSSLQAVRLGVIKDYAYGSPVDAYVLERQNASRLVVMAGGDEIPRMYHMVRLGRLDTFLEDRYTARWSLTRAELDVGALREAGCLSPAPFYLALDPRLPWSGPLLERLDAALVTPANLQRRDQIIQRYGLN